MDNRDLRELLIELASGGILIVDPFPERDDEQIAFRTVLQLGGDVLLAIHAEALARPDFAALLAAHQRRVASVLERKRRGLERLATRFGTGAGVLSLVIGAGFGYGSFMADLQSISLEWAIAAAGTVGGVLFIAVRRTLGEFTLRLLLRRWTAARGRARAGL